LRNQGSLRCACGSEWDSPPCPQDECLPEKRLMQIFEQQDQGKLDSVMSVISACGVARNKISSVSHMVFDTATAIVFGDIDRLEHILPDIWESLDLVQARIVAVKLKKIHPNVARLIDALSKKDSSNMNKERTGPITAIDMRLLLGVTQRVWVRFIKANKIEYKKHYNYVDFERLRHLFKDFEAEIKKNKALFESEITSSCHPLNITSKLLELTHAECSILSQKEILSPTAKIRTRPYYHKDDIIAFQTSFISTRKLASRLKVTHAQMITALTCCEAVKPLINHAGMPFLVRTEEIRAVTQAINNIPTKTNSLKGQVKINRCNTDNLQTVTLVQAADHLNVHRSSVIYYRDLGLIRCSTENSRVFVFDDVEQFYERFTTPRILGKELYLPHNKIGSILETHNIHAISGKLVNGNTHTIYDRNHLPKDLYTLINPTHDTFGVCLSLNQVMTLQDAAKTLGITYGDIQRLVFRDIRPARPPQYKRHGSISYDEINSLREKISNYSRLSDCLNAFNITHAAFWRRFVSPGYVHPLKLNNQEYLTQSDANKLKNFMYKYCTPKEAAKILGLSTAYITHLMKEKIIPFCRVLDYDYPHPVLRRMEVQAMLELRLKS
jgi:DNA-binding transcriptional MerR regulator